MAQLIYYNMGTGLPVVPPAGIPTTVPDGPVYGPPAPATTTTTTVTQPQIGVPIYNQPFIPLPDTGGQQQQQQQPQQQTQGLTSMLPLILIGVVVIALIK